MVHAVLTDTTAWRLWSPHVARVDTDQEIIEAAGWSGLVKPWFGPATRMDVPWWSVKRAPARTRWSSHG